MLSTYDYLREPAAIYRLSAERVRQATDVSHLPETLKPLAYRLVHASGMPDVVTALAWRGEAMVAACRALRGGASILVDCEMLADGIMRQRLPADNAVLCTLNDGRTAALARQLQTTRSAAAVELWGDRLDGAVVAIGNAPTALFRLLELVQQGNDAPTPAALFAFPVGFVGAAESKAALVEASLDIPYVTLLGRRGGSAMAAAAINALGGELDS